MVVVNSPLFVFVHWESDRLFGSNRSAARMRDIEVHFAKENGIMKDKVSCTPRMFTINRGASEGQLRRFSL